MFDATPAPFGDVTRRWTYLDDVERDRHVARLLGAECVGEPFHVDRPSEDEGRCYRQLVVAALNGDEIAFAWLATSHRPLLLTRGRLLSEEDPSEWGGLCLWLLHSAMGRAPLWDVRWLRRHVARRLTSRLSTEMEHHAYRRSRERATAPTIISAGSPLRPIEEWDPHPDLSLELEDLLGVLDEPSREGLWALANHEPLAEVADRHGLTYAALRQRVSRARRRLQPQLVQYRRARPTVAARVDAAAA